jgi:hemolysin III
MLAFGLGLALCYGGSCLFHAVPLSLEETFNLVDHLGIYTLIAGTVTPIALVVLRGWWRLGLLALIWLLAVTGTVLRLTTELPLAYRTGFYLLMGWIGCITYAELARHLSHAKLRPMWVGGLFYSAGAIFNAAHWPRLAPPVFGTHELFHLFVMAGSLCHYHFMLAVLVPYRRPVPVPVSVPAAEGAEVPDLALPTLSRRAAES